MKKTEVLKRKKVSLIILITLAFLALIIIAMQVTTNALMKEIEIAFLSDDYYVNEERFNEHEELYTNPNINYVVYKFDEQRYNIDRWFNRSKYSQGDNPENVQINLKLNRLFTFHNFFDGYIWFYYRVDYLDKNGNHLSGAITTPFYPVKMKIHKENGKWQVVQIWEKP